MVYLIHISDEQTMKIQCSRKEANAFIEGLDFELKEVTQAEYCIYSIIIWLRRLAVIKLAVYLWKKL